MIYSHKTANEKKNISQQEKQMLEKLVNSKPSAWMVETKTK